jgi:hypothetical protein
MGASLAIMAASLAVMALVQVGLIIAAVIVVKRSLAAVAELQREVRPLIEKANRIADEAQRTSSLVALQMERVDGLMASTATRLDNTLGIVQHAMSGPVGQGVAAVKAFQAAMSVVRDWKSRRRRHAHEDEDALFVG